MESPFNATVRSWSKTAVCFAVLMATQACSDGSVSSSTKNVFGRDDRIRVPKTSVLYGLVARVDSGCSAVLVGENLALTAAHCVIDNNGNLKPSGLYVRTEFERGSAARSAAVEDVWYGSNAPEQNREKDWAILKLSTRLGKDGNWLAVTRGAFAGTSLPATAGLAGFSSDRDLGRAAFVQEKCTVHGRDGNRLLHDCDSYTGISGAPMFRMSNGKPEVVALTVSEFRQGATTSVRRDEYSPEYANVAIDVEVFAGVLTKLKETVEAGLTAPVLEGAFHIDVPGPRPWQDPPRSLTEYDWFPIDSFKVSIRHGRNSFDVAYANSLQANPLKVEFAPAACAHVADIKLHAITSPESNEWEAATMFEKVGALLSSDDAKFIRLTFENESFNQENCEIKFYGTQVEAWGEGRKGLALMSAVEDKENVWYCEASPYNDRSWGSYYWYSASVDDARFVALNTCTKKHGYLCTSTCSIVPWNRRGEAPPS